MDYSCQDSNEFSVEQGAFWHCNMEIYYGYQHGEVVEVEHESNKYWLATIEYSFEHLVLLKWIGDYGEFWVNTSCQNSLNAPNLVYNEFNAPKRLFPPGYHLQSQIKAQFVLERPSKVLSKPSLYDPSNDPYADIKTVQELLAHEIVHIKDTFGKQSSENITEPASLALAKCKTKISYGQEDAAELEAALQNLNDIDSNAHTIESPDSFNLANGDIVVQAKLGSQDIIMEDDTVRDSTEPSTTVEQIGIEIYGSKQVDGIDSSSLDKNDTIKNCDHVHEHNLEVCKNLQESAISKGRYLGIGENSHKVYYLKPKQYFDVGGANHDRVFVPGTLLEVCHTWSSEQGLKLYHWFAIVVKNTGGRLALRWFLCDEPKFKQGRVEMKSFKSELVKEDDSDASEDDKVDEECTTEPDERISAKSITFCMNFCNPCIHSITQGKSLGRKYRLPSDFRGLIEKSRGEEYIRAFEKNQKKYVFDQRRINLDKDRPIIDHLLSTARWMTPRYINVSYAPNDQSNRREILFSTPRTTKLFKGFLKRELEPGVFEIHSEPIPEDGDVIKFIYPYNSSYSILPTSWAINNQDCLSIDPSRNPSPVPIEKPESIDHEKESGDKSDSLKPTIDSLEAEPTNLLNVSSYTLLCEIPKLNLIDHLESYEEILGKSDFDELEPSHWTRLIRKRELQATEFECNVDTSSMNSTVANFKVMDLLEVVHPSSDLTICLGRIRKVVYPLLWIQISADSFTVLPFNSTDIYPTKWCEFNNHPLVSLLPPRKRLNQSAQSDKKRTKKSKSDDVKEYKTDDDAAIFEKEHFDLGALDDKQLDINYILNEKSMYIRIYFNHKCFTGPSLSKGKICSLPQYVGPGPLRLVIEEVVTKVISVAYVPPRILNDLSSKSFEDLLIARGMTNTAPMAFKAKYQKRVHREFIPICLNPDDVTLYCECICEHLKCCYNLFGPNLYDGDDCPGHCRVLTKSNKFMKRATYYREKARLGEFTSDNGNSKKSNNATNNSSKSSRARYAGRDSSESTSSSLSRSEQIQSRASSNGDDVPVNELKENLVELNENEIDSKLKTKIDLHDNPGDIQPMMISDVKDPDPEMEKVLHPSDCGKNYIKVSNRPPIKWPNESEFTNLDVDGFRPDEWTVDDVANNLGWCHLDRFKPYMLSEGVDGQALLLLDKVAIKEHFQYQSKSEYSQEEVGKLCRFVEFVKARAHPTTRV